MELVQPIRDKKHIDSIKRYLKGSSLRDYCLFTLGINSALRISDLLKLNIGDVVDDDNKIKDRIILREKKTNKNKDFPLADTAKKTIMEYLKERKDYDFNEPLFLSRKSKNKKTAIQRDQAYKIIKNAAVAVGLNYNVGTHTMRKTFAYQAIKSGVGIIKVQQVLNHSSPGITLAYAGITQDELDNIYLNLNL